MLFNKISNLIRAINKPNDRLALIYKKKFIYSLKKYAQFNKNKDFDESKYSKILVFHNKEDNKNKISDKYSNKIFEESYNLRNSNRINSIKGDSVENNFNDKFFEVKKINISNYFYQISNRFQKKLNTQILNTILRKSIN